MKILFALMAILLFTEKTFAVDDEVMNFFNEEQKLNLAIPADTNIESMELVVTENDLFKRNPNDTINKNILFANGSPMVGLAGMTPYEAVREDGLLFDREGDGSTVCTTAHQKLINGELNHKDISDFTCHSVVATAVGVTVSNAVYANLRDQGFSKGLAKAVSYASAAIAGVGAMAAKEKIYDKIYETADIGTGLVPLYEADNGFGIYYIGDLYKRKSLFMVVHFK